MVLIISEHTDASTNWVIDWLAYYGVKFQRINRNDLLFSQENNITYFVGKNIDEFNIKVAGTDIDVNDITAVWFRRSVYKNLHKEIFHEIKDEGTLIEVRRNFYYEYLNANKLVFSSLERGKKVLGNFRKFRLNKIEILQIAKRNGLDIPNSLITNKKEDLINFIKCTGPVITKAISDVIDITIKTSEETSLFINYTEEITEDNIHGISSSFFYSLFQEKLIKDIEIRVFYLAGRCYSMAIFSQLDNQTSTDFRKYSNNRNVPYKLPADLESRINNFMVEIEFNTGSLDFVKTRDGRFVFLEVNTTGQYGMTSFPCNYYLDKKVAEYLIDNEK